MAAEACDKSHSFFFACSIGPFFMFCMLSLLFGPGLNTLKRHMAAEARDKSLFFPRDVHSLHVNILRSILHYGLVDTIAHDQTQRKSIHS